MPAQAPPLTDERELLLAYVSQQRDGIRYAAFGLTDDQIRQAPTVSSLSIGGLIKHVTRMERDWMHLVERQPSDVSKAGREVTRDDPFELKPDDTLAGLLARYDEVARRTEAIVMATTLDAPVPVPKGVPWFPDDLEAWSVRWVLLHLVEETARHAGHADLIRETVDGATMYPLMAAAEGWPATDWLKPWEPAS